MDGDSDVFDSRCDGICFKDVDAWLAVNKNWDRGNERLVETDEFSDVLKVSSTFGGSEGSARFSIRRMQRNDTLKMLLPIHDTASEEQEDAFNGATRDMITCMVRVNDANEAIRKVN